VLRWGCLPRCQSLGRPLHVCERVTDSFAAILRTAFRTPAREGVVFRQGKIAQSGFLQGHLLYKAVEHGDACVCALSSDVERVV
jgi:hypothetical protein